MFTKQVQTLRRFESYRHSDTIWIVQAVHKTSTDSTTIWIKQFTKQAQTRTQAGKLSETVTQILTLRDVGDEK